MTQQEKAEKLQEIINNIVNDDTKGFIIAGEFDKPENMHSFILSTVNANLIEKAVDDVLRDVRLQEPTQTSNGLGKDTYMQHT